MKSFVFAVACLGTTVCAQAAEVYQLAGIAQSFRPGHDESRVISAPTVAHYASTLSIDGDEVTLHYGGGDATCTAHIEKRQPYAFDDGPIAIIRGNRSEATVAAFYQQHFGVDIRHWSFEYYLGVPAQYAKDLPTSPCTELLNGAVLYGSDQNLSIVDGHSFVYLLKRANAGPLPLVHEAGLDCRLAQGKAEQLVCGDRELAALDGDVFNIFDNLYAEQPDAMARKQWLKGQTDWLKTVRDKCATVECLKQAYAKRKAYLDSQTPDQPD